MIPLLHFTQLPPFERYIKKIIEKPLKDLFKKAVAAILADPYSGQAKVGDLQGFWGYDVKYQGVNYEIAYVIIENDNGTPQSVVFYMAGTRENFYDEIKRYIRKSKKST